ncbi:N-acetylmuramoyl-L-alanine amidase [Anaerovirgula multivorans]|uniref:N-acetylmuramoyl-L-alanine amidase n=1 Tax=Anaerovirgula multivorans TaxID=312168 RepID=A0A239AIN0_9FIRM|nr:N-acetylmuramoyl-L-alanine amidase [Anaerovirgula multivorans]SNR95202.1 N-acetylmuramoyl-L-alanine amidase [Anaerovirgula multivorans]
MNYIKDYIPKSKDKRPGTKIEPQWITIHNTANSTSTARNERNYLTNPLNTNYASWHIVVDEKEAIEAIPLDEVAYHAGNSTGNSTSIGIEVCESGNQTIVWQNAVSLVAKMLQERGWEIERVRTHYSWSGKNCPRLILPRWNEFISDIQKELLKLNGVKEPEKVLDEASEWAKTAQSWVKENGVSDGTNPKGNVTREQMWQMIYDYDRKVKK